MARLLLAVMCIVLLSSPARAREDEGDLHTDYGDIMLRATVGIPLTILGAVAMIPVGFATLITRPSEIDKPFEYLVMGPVRYTWVDPVGEHPVPDKSQWDHGTGHSAGQVRSVATHAASEDATPTPSGH
jgi:hypothetical protein